MECAFIRFDILKFGIFSQLKIHGERYASDKISHNYKTKPKCEFGLRALLQMAPPHCMFFFFPLDGARAVFRPGSFARRSEVRQTLVGRLRPSARQVYWDTRLVSTERCWLSHVGIFQLLCSARMSIRVNICVNVLFKKLPVLHLVVLFIHLFILCE